MKYFEKIRTSTETSDLSFMTFFFVFLTVALRFEKVHVFLNEQQSHEYQNLFGFNLAACDLVGLHLTEILE